MCNIGRGRSGGRSQKKKTKQVGLREQSMCLLSSIHTQQLYVQENWQFFLMLFFSKMVKWTLENINLEDTPPPKKKNQHLTTTTTKKPQNQTPFKLVWKNELLTKRAFWSVFIYSVSSQSIQTNYGTVLQTQQCCILACWRKGLMKGIPNKNSMLNEIGLSQTLCYPAGVSIFITTFIDGLWGLHK